MKQIKQNTKQITTHDIREMKGDYAGTFKRLVPILNQINRNPELYERTGMKQLIVNRDFSFLSSFSGSYAYDVNIGKKRFVFRFTANHNEQRLFVTNGNRVAEITNYKLGHMPSEFGGFAPISSIYLANNERELKGFLEDRGPLTTVYEKFRIGLKTSTGDRAKGVVFVVSEYSHYYDMVNGLDLGNV